MRRSAHSRAKNSPRAADASRARARRCIVLGDLTESLLQAYECVARRAYQRFLARGAEPGGELDDWLAAERELLSPVTVDFQESEGFIHALAAAPCFSRARVDVSIEPRWLAILAECEASADEPRACAAAPKAAAARRDSRAGSSALPPSPKTGEPAEPGPASRQRSRNAPSADSPDGSPDGLREFAADAPPDDAAPPLQAFCIVQLPVAVIPKDSIAVLADGLLGIRMPKAAKAAKAAPAPSLDHHAAR